MSYLVVVYCYNVQPATSSTSTNNGRLVACDCDYLVNNR
jgi:hypothetical protein